MMQSLPLRSGAVLAAASLLLAAGMLFLPAGLSHAAGTALGLLLLAWALCLAIRKKWTHPWRLTHPYKALTHLTIDGDLLAAPRRMTAAHLPFDAAPQPKLRSGALLWACAATVTHTLADERDRAAILAAVKPLGFTPDTFLARCPILGEVAANGQHGYVVRDGSGCRAYFLGQPNSLLRACTHVWDQQERQVAEDDLSRLPSSQPGLYGLAMAPADDSGIGPMTYLGSIQIASPLRNTNVPEHLAAYDIRVLITPSSAAPEHNAALQALSTSAEAPPDTLHVGLQPTDGSCYTVEDPDHEDFAEQIIQGALRLLRQQGKAQQAFFAPLFLALTATLWSLPAWCIPLSMLAMLPRSLARLDADACGHRSSTLVRMLLRLCGSFAWCAVFSLALLRFAAYVDPAGSAAVPLAFCSFAMLLAITADRMMLMPVLPAGIALTAAVWLLLQPPVMLGLFCLLAGLMQALILRLILHPLDCS